MVLDFVKVSLSLIWILSTIIFLKIRFVFLIFQGGGLFVNQISTFPIQVNSIIFDSQIFKFEGSHFRPHYLFVERWSFKYSKYLVESNNEVSKQYITPFICLKHS